MAKRKHGGDACSAMFCSNARWKEKGLSFFSFPKEETRFVCLFISFLFSAGVLFILLRLAKSINQVKQSRPTKLVSNSVIDRISTNFA